VRTWIGSKSFLVSLLIHGLVICAIVFVCLQKGNHAIQTAPVGNSSVSVYLKENLAYASLRQGYKSSIDQKTIQRGSLNKKNEVSAVKERREQKQLTERKSPKAIQHQTIQPSSLNTANAVSAVKEKSKQQLAIKGKINSALLIKLHNLIQQQVNNLAVQIPSFLKGRKASVSFQLNSQGIPKNIRLDKSTGSSWLDQLALQAVKSIQLKAHAGEKIFQVTIILD
jgi:TonB family protein